MAAGAAWGSPGFSVPIPRFFAPPSPGAAHGGSRCRRHYRDPPVAIPGIPVLCAGCGSGIWDRFLLRVNERPWHERCVRCCECSQPLRGSCFCRQHRLYCRPDYRRWVPTLGQGFAIFSPGFSQFFPHFSHFFPHFSPFFRIFLAFFLLSKIPIFPAAQSEDEEENSRNNSQNSPNSQGKDPKRPKRPRTILSSQQRRAFRASFQVSPKPCRKVREALAAQTGLTLRVVQVWFQNQRAKMKKLARRQQQENSRGGISGSRRSHGNGDGKDSEGIFQEPPGAVLGSLGEENSQQLLLELLRDPRIPKIPGIPGIPEPGNPIDHLYSMQSSYFTS
ncbi:LIM homeobox transcription factor 1-alpha-like [Sylvia borin]